MSSCAFVIVALVPIDGSPTTRGVRASVRSMEAAARAVAVARGEPLGASSVAAAVERDRARSFRTSAIRPDPRVPARRSRSPSRCAIATPPRGRQTGARGGEALVSPLRRGGSRSSRGTVCVRFCPSDLPAGGGDVVPMTVDGASAHRHVHREARPGARRCLGWFSTHGAAGRFVPAARHRGSRRGLWVDDGPAAIVAQRRGAGRGARHEHGPAELGRGRRCAGAARLSLARRRTATRSCGTARAFRSRATSRRVATSRSRVNVRAPESRGRLPPGVGHGPGRWHRLVLGSRGPAEERRSSRVWDGVTIYGKGWGHGIGLSQWGAQGWAQGAAGGPRLTGEQIVAKYFPGARLATQPITQPFRVLLSAPSTGCVGNTIANVARMESAGGMRLVNNSDQTDRVRRDRAEPAAAVLERRRNARRAQRVVARDRLRGRRHAHARAQAGLGPDLHRREGPRLPRQRSASVCARAAICRS